MCVQDWFLGVFVYLQDYVGLFGYLDVFFVVLDVIDCVGCGGWYRDEVGVVDVVVGEFLCYVFVVVDYDCW